MPIQPMLKHPLFIIVFSVIATLITFYVGIHMWGTWYDEWSGYTASVSISDGICNVAIIPVTGEIYTDEPTHDGSEYSPVANADDIVSLIKMAEYDPSIFGMVIRIDSPGGGPVASQVIADAIKQSPLYSVALIREQGTSGGYLAATGADTIFAYSLSDIGSIAITMSYIDYSTANAREGIHFNELTSGTYKDTGNPNKPLTQRERALLEDNLTVFQDELVSIIAENRGLPIEEVAAIADGSSMTPSFALEHGLIDAIGNQEDTRTWFAEQWGVSVDEVIFCE
jgi:protease-4